MASKLEKLNLTNDELDRFKKAMEDPTFRDLLREYTDEISNPANRAEHEAYLREVEARAANDPAAMEGDYSGVHGIQVPKGCKLISPTPVMCIKVVVPSGTSRTLEKKTVKSSKAEKFFINMCICDAMDDVSSQKVNGEGPKAGQQFSLPYSMTGPRETKDTKGEEAKVYDFIFSEATWKQYALQMRVVVMFQEMAVEALEERESIRNGTLDKSATVILKNTTFKGGKPPPRVFKMSEEKVKQQKETNAAATTKASAPTTAAATKKPSSKIEEVSSSDEPEKPKETRQTPKHTLVHRGYYEMSQEQLILEGERTLLSELAQSRPKELVVKIELPLVQKISEVNLDQSVNQILLTSAQYFLLLPLPYPVIEEHCSASWSGKAKTLTITCKVGPISDSELEKYKAQRATYDGMVEKKAALAKAEAQAEADAEAAEAANRLVQERLQREQQQAEQAKKAQEEAEAEAAAEKQRRIEIEDQSALKPTSPNPSLPSALKHSPHSSPRLDADGHPRHVRFSFSLPQSESGIPERDGPLGPKPVGKLVEEIVIPPVHKGKGHKKKHVPGAEGPEAWTGIGKEPSKEIMDHFPPDQVPMLESPTNQGKKGGAANKSPSLNSANSPTNGNAATRLWPAYSYSQSKVSVTLVIKIKSIANDSVKLVVDDRLHPGGEKRSSIDLYFSTTSPKKHYRLFLPLAYPVVSSKCNFQVSAQNIILNLLKTPQSPSSSTGDAAAADSATEWDHLLDYSLMGDFDAEGTPLNSPQVSSSKSTAAVMQMMDELSLGISAQNHHALIEEMQEQTAAEISNGNGEDAAAEPVPVVTMQPIAVDASAMLNPFVAAASGAPAPSSASKAAPSTKAVPSNSLLFQLD